VNKRLLRQPSVRMPAGLPAHPASTKAKQETRPLPTRRPREAALAKPPQKAAPEPAPPRPLARLVSLDEQEMSIPGGIIQVTGAEMTFGSDPQRATRVIDSTTVSGLHARLYHDAENHFYLADQNTIAGTWINYAPVTERGARLEHGDLIHIGRCMFRFELIDPTQARLREIKVSGPEKESQQKAGDRT
jgi:hypothetical protein